MKTYLMVYSDKLGDREAVKRILGLMPEISHWRYDMPHSFYLWSEASAQELVNSMVSHISQATSKRFIITEITDNRQGYLPRETWNFINQTALR